MKYKIGDKVRIKRDLKRGYGFKLSVTKKMEEFAGKIVTIKEADRNDDTYKTEEVGYDWFSEDMIESLTKPTKEELFNMPLGTIVKTDREEHNVYVKVGENDFCNDCADHMQTHHVNDDLTLNMYGTKILEIQKPTYETIYKADKEPKKMTQKEIEKKLGYPIEIIEEK